MRRSVVLTWTCAVLLAAALTACDPQKIAKLEVGVSTEADVRGQFGEPAATYAEDDGARTLEYPRQPEGHTNYMITIGTDGKMRALRQVLEKSEFIRIRTGLDKVQVRRILGRPARMQRFHLSKTESWEWRWIDNPIRKLFTATFDADGHVISTSNIDEPERSTSGGQ